MPFQPEVIEYALLVTTCSSAHEPCSSLKIKYVLGNKLHTTTIHMAVAKFAKMVEDQVDMVSYIRTLDMTTGQNDFYYSNKYEDDEYEYRHVHVTKEVAKLIPKNRLMSETEWRSLGIQQSPGWVHYMIHGPERHVLLFRRPLPNKSNVAGKSAAQAQVGVR
ncbi:Cyclin-dependent kinase regulatory subunit [Dictyocaulus viviparus]|uniref:Cyclin-dependent kinases regulatory subunit n=1 Tax=Dictyocaulus viviparus TaxID=29172 RepID=A0A0D8Y792_DICVI|nr:Cyclin-dependent kinase regulatory subunit [Dictyocaulus viviparus]